MDPYQTYTVKQLFEQLAQTRERREAEQLLGEIIKRYEKPLVGKLRTLIPYNEDLIAQVLNDVFMDVWKKRRTLASVETPRAWLLQVLSFKVSDAFRKRKNNEEYMGNIPQDYFEIPENHPDFDEERYRRMEERIQEAIERLPLMRRTIFTMKKLDGFSIEGIARMLKLKEQTVKNHLYLAKLQLRKILKKSRKEGWK